MRILFFMTHAGHARNFESTLRLLAQRDHQVHVALDQYEKKDMPDLNELLQAIAGEHPNVTMGPTPRVSKTDWAPVGARFRATLDLISYSDSGLDRSERFRERAERAVPRPLRPVARVDRARPLLRRALQTAEAGTPVPSQIQAYVAEQQPDVVLITPLVQIGSPQLDYIRAARAVGLPTGLLVHSWDNLTVKGLVHEAPDLTTVWNEQQKREAVELHHIAPERVEITGAAPYDHWFDWRPSSDKAAFCKRLGLDPDRPIVLYVGSSKFVAPREGEFIREWATDLLSEPRETMPEFQVLVRPHPTIPLTGTVQERLEALDHVVVYPPKGANPTNLQARVDYFDSMYHSSAVVGINTTAFIESAIINRPIYSLLTPRYRDTQKGSQHFRYLLPSNGGMLNVATSPLEHSEQLAAALRGETSEALQRNREFVASFIRPLGIDRPATPCLVDAIERLAGVTPVPASEQSLGARVAGQVIATGGRSYVSRRLRKARARKRGRAQHGTGDVEHAKKAKPSAKGTKPPKKPTGTRPKASARKEG